MSHELDYISVTGTAMAILLNFPIQLDWFNKMITNHPQYNSFPLKKGSEIQNVLFGGSNLSKFSISSRLGGLDAWKYVAYIQLWVKGSS